MANRVERPSDISVRRRHKEQLDTIAVRSKIPSFTGDNFHDFNEGVGRIFQAVAESDFYLFSRDVAALPNSHIPVWPNEHFDLLYSNVRPAAHRFAEAQGALEDVGEELMEKDQLGIDDLVKSVPEILGAGSAQVQSLGTITDAEAVAPRSRNVGKLSGRQQFIIRNFCNEVGRTKHPFMHEHLRRFMPRWMTHPLDAPAEQDIDPHIAAKLPLWGSYTTREANFLISDENIAEGKAPIHVVLTAARVAEANGDHDVAYAAKTHAILQTLAMEKERFEQDDPEMPFFTYVMGGIIAGGKPERMKKGFFDYAGALDDTIGQTLVRFQEEAEDEEPGMATQFLSKLADFYPDLYPQLVAVSMVRHAESSFNVDMMSILQSTKYPLRGTVTEQVPWMAQVYDTIEQNPYRKILTMQEAVEGSQVLPQTEPSEEPAAEQTVADVTKLLGDDDSSGFRVELHRLELTGASDVIMTVDLDRISETADVLVDIYDGQKTRLVPVTMNFAADPESIRIKAMDSGPVPAESAAAYRRLIAEVLKRRADTLRANEAKQKIGKTTSEAAVEAAPAIESGSLTRAERIERYEAQRLAATHRKRRATGRPVTPDVARPGVVFAESEPSVGLTIHGVDRETVGSMLEDEKISAVTADTLIKKINHVADMAAISQKMLGKRINLDSVGPEAEGINLRQINLAFDDRHTAIRVYVEDIGGGEFALRGIMLKKGEKQQERYIKKLTGDLIAARSAST